jgi:hypothetical protein
MTPKADLIKAFDGLTDTQLRRLAIHAKRRTPVCCGDRSSLFTDGEGGA